MQKVVYLYKENINKVNAIAAVESLPNFSETLRFIINNFNKRREQEEKLDEINKRLDVIEKYIGGDGDDAVGEV